MMALQHFFNRMETRQMKQNRINTGRRSFLKAGSLAAVSAAFAGSVGKAAAQGAKVDEKDAQAQSLGYKHDATKVDKAKFAKYQAAQTCATCMLYQGKPADAWGDCPIFPGKQVAGKGWCSAWVKKA
jgi:high potential iron-sulfur protein